MRSRVHLAPVSGFGLSVPVRRDVLHDEVRTELRGFIDSVETLDTVFPSWVVYRDDRLPLSADEGNIVWQAEADLLELCMRELTGLTSEESGTGARAYAASISQCDMTLNGLLSESAWTYARTGDRD